MGSRHLVRLVTKALKTAVLSMYLSSYDFIVGIPVVSQLHLPRELMAISCAFYLQVVNDITCMDIDGDQCTDNSAMQI